MGANWKLSLAALLSALIFVTSTEHLKPMPRQSVQIEMQVALPLFVQVFMAAGDRFLAANIAAIRAVVVDNFKMKREDFKILAKVQDDVSWLNPGHEDNYYVAAAILPWNGEVELAQRILARATRFRPFDYQPAFLYAFNQLHFYADAQGASLWLRDAAERMPDPDNRLIMQNYAARWADKADDLGFAIQVVESMAKQAKRRDFQRYLQIRVARLQALQELRHAETEYRQRFSQPLARLQDLVESGVITSLPKDPFGFGYDIDAKGRIILRNSPASSAKK
jgi:hypothetical protein